MVVDDLEKGGPKEEGPGEGRLGEGSLKEKT